MRIFKSGEPNTRSAAFLDWLREHDIDPDATYRVEVQEDKMTAFRFVRKNGYAQADERGEVLIEPPLTVKLHSEIPI